MGVPTPNLLYFNHWQSSNSYCLLLTDTHESSLINQLLKSVIEKQLNDLFIQPMDDLITQPSDYAVTKLLDTSVDQLPIQPVEDPSLNRRMMQILS